MSRGYLHVGLEIGTTKVAAVIGETSSDGLLRIIGVGEAPSRGVRKGEVVDISKITLSLTDAVSTAEEQADREISEVLAAVTGSHLESLNNRGGVSIPEDRGEIDEEDVVEVQQSALDLSLPAGNVFLHSINQLYTIDGNGGVTQPVGMYGRRLEAEFHIIHAAKTRIQNNLRCVHEVNLRPSIVVASSLASSSLAMPPRSTRSVILAAREPSSHDVSSCSRDARQAFVASASNALRASMKSR